MNILLAGGGTAGHINPAIAIANTIKSHDPSSNIAFIGTSRGLENDLVKKAGYPIYRIEMTGLRRSLSLKNIKTAYYYFTAPIKAKKLLREFRPDIVLGTGGYLSWPLLKAAHSLGIPSAIHESNAIPGKAVLMLADKVNRIYLNFPSAADCFKDKSKIKIVGNPLIESKTSLEEDKLRETLDIPQNVKTIVLSFGGSLGAEQLTHSIISVANEFESENKDVFFIHSAGKNKYDDAIKEAASVEHDSADNIRIMKYIYNMPDYEKTADIIICRAGAMTISELAQMGKAAIIVPSPYVANNHQYENAKRLSDAGAAVMIEEKEFTPERLKKELTSLINDKKKQKSLCENIRRFAYPQAKERIYNDLTDIIRQSADWH